MVQADGRIEHRAERAPLVEGGGRPPAVADRRTPGLTKHASHVRPASARRSNSSPRPWATTGRARRNRPRRRRPSPAAIATPGRSSSQTQIESNVNQDASAAPASLEPPPSPADDGQPLVEGEGESRQFGSARRLSQQRPGPHASPDCPHNAAEPLGARSLAPSTPCPSSRHPALSRSPTSAKVIRLSIGNDSRPPPGGPTCRKRLTLAGANAGTGDHRTGDRGQAWRPER